METVHLKINSKVYDHVMWLLKQFNTEDVEIISDDFWKVKAELDESLRQIDNGEMEFFSVEEFEQRANDFLAKRDED